jgi:hypothetical protein
MNPEPDTVQWLVEILKAIPLQHHWPHRVTLRQVPFSGFFLVLQCLLDCFVLWEHVWHLLVLTTISAVNELHSPSAEESNPKTNSQMRTQCAPLTAATSRSRSRGR